MEVVVKGLDLILEGALALVGHLLDDGIHGQSHAEHSREEVTDTIITFIFMFHQFPFLPYFIPSHHMFRSTDLPRRYAALSLSRLAVVRELAVPSFLSL